MMWYYEQSGEQRGPVTDADLENLLRAGTIDGNTLVWREGMANWATYSEAKGSSGSTARATGPSLGIGEVVCSECGNMFSAAEVVKFGDRSVCAACKPIYVQKLREGASVAGMMEYAGFWIRFGAKFVDGIILQIAGMVVGFIAGFLLRGSGAEVIAFVIYPLTLVLNAAYYIFFVGKFGATPGKMAAKVRIVNVDGSSISYGRACGRYFAELLSALTLGIGYIMAAFDDEKRALHDRICATRVIKASSR